MIVCFIWLLITLWSCCIRGLLWHLAWVLSFYKTRLVTSVCLRWLRLIKVAYIKVLVQCDREYVLYLLRLTLPLILRLLFPFLSFISSLPLYPIIPFILSSALILLYLGNTNVKSIMSTLISFQPEWLQSEGGTDWIKSEMWTSI